tara:strand:+ start:1102 stop:1434 length:333 start_codon:yes stop_codon:yes gene_type:complete
MSSSVREKIYEVEKQKKINRRIAKLIQEDMDSSFISVDSFNNKNQKLEEEVTNATKERQEPENNQPEYKEIEVGEIPTEASDSDSVIESREEKVKTSKPKKKSKKTTKKT